MVGGCRKYSPKRTGFWSQQQKYMHYYSKIQKKLAIHGIELSISITVLKSVRDLFVMEHSAKHPQCSV